MYYIWIKMSFDGYNQKYKFRDQSAEEVERPNRDKKDRNKKSKVHLILLQNKYVL